MKYIILGAFAFLLSTQSYSQTKTEYKIGSAAVTVTQKTVKGKYGEFEKKTYQVEKIYKDRDQWKSTDKFDRDELLQLRAAIDKAILEEAVEVKD